MLIEAARDTEYARTPDALSPAHCVGFDGRSTPDVIALQEVKYLCHRGPKYCWFVIQYFSRTVTSWAELPPLSVACWARDGVGRVRYVRNSLDFSYLDPPRPATFFARDFSLATTLLTGSHRLSLPGG